MRVRKRCPRSVPLEAYSIGSFETTLTDAYDRFCDRFCTLLEQRFTWAQIEQMLGEAGFNRIVFSDEVPFWCAVARKA
jgi:hypothetical protein